MQTLIQNRSFTRIIMLVFASALIILASWRLASTQGLSSRLEETYAFLADSSRTNASTDQSIQTLQERLRANPNDWQSYSRLGMAYLQKARETGDPTYYQKTEQPLDKALSFPADD